MTIGHVSAGTGAGAAPQGASKAPGSSQMAAQLATPQLFIKLLMAELEHEDPTNPTTPSSILQQTADLSQVEAVTSMTAAVQAEQRVADTSAATSLVGRNVSAVVTGTTVSGSVSSVSLRATGTPVLEVRAPSVAGSSSPAPLRAVPLGDVTDVVGTTGVSAG